MADSSDKIKFWTVLIAIMLGVSIAVLLIDVTIKTAILEESNALRRTILGIQDDGTAEASANGASHNGHSPGAVLDLNATRMETGNVANGSQEADSASGEKKPRTNPRRSRGGNIPPGD